MGPSSVNTWRTSLKRGRFRPLFTFFREHVYLFPVSPTAGNKKTVSIRELPPDSQIQPSWRRQAFPPPARRHGRKVRKIIVLSAVPDGGMRICPGMPAAQPPYPFPFRPLSASSSSMMAPAMSADSAPPPAAIFCLRRSISSLTVPSGYRSRRSPSAFSQPSSS